MQKSPFIKVTEHGSTAIIQLNRPEALNALSVEILEELDHLLRLFEEEKKLVVFKGLPNVFSVGGDVKSFINLLKENLFDQSGRTLEMIANYKIPYIALVHATAMGGASMYSMTARYRVVTEKTTFAMPENAIGYFTDGGASYFLSRLERNLGVYMALTGAKISGSDMMKYKLATHFVESSKLVELEKSLIICKTHNEVAQVLNVFSTAPHQSKTEIDSILPQIEKCFGSSTVEGIYENLEHDGSDWAKKTIKILNKMSPTSLKVTHRCLKLGKHLSLRDNLRMEYGLVKHYFGIGSSFAHKEMKEGIRALLVDKDFKPRWNPPTLGEVTDKLIDELFKPPADGSKLSFENIHQSHL